MGRDSLRTPDGRTLAWDTLGSGPPLLLHGGGPGGDPGYLSDFPPLDPPRTLIALHARGTGASTRPQTYGLVEYADDVELVRHYLGIDRLDALGHSHGGFVLQTWAAAHPRRTGRLILAGSHASFENVRADGPALIARHAEESWYADAMSAHQERIAREAELGDAELASLYARAVRLLFAVQGEREQALWRRIGLTFNGDALRWFNSNVAESFDLRHLLPEITGPTLVLSGERDPVAPPSAAAELAAGLPAAMLEMVPGTGHFAPWETHGREHIAAAISGFLRS